MTTYETIHLRKIEGISQLSGTDENGCAWTQFETDYGAEQEPGECSICGREIESGWLCLDGGEEVCSSHVEYLNPHALDMFTKSYIEAALWSSTDETGESLDAAYTVDDLAPETFQQMVEDCEAFLTDHIEWVIDDLARAGADFWLTRNRHGAGFWDGGWKHSRELTDAAHVYGSVDLFVSNEGSIYSS